MTVNEFIKSLAANGLHGEFKATNGEHTYPGTIKENGTRTTIKVQTVAESQKKIKEILRRE
jgi:hypothetical protein